MHIYNWYHSNVTGIHYVHEHRLQRVQDNPLASYFSPFSFAPHSYPLYLLGTLLAVIGSVHLVSRLLVNWSSHFPPLAHLPPIPKSRPPEFPRSKYTFIRMTSRTWLTRSSTRTKQWVKSGMTLIHLIRHISFCANKSPDCQVSSSFGKIPIYCASLNQFSQKTGFSCKVGNGPSEME